MKKLLIIIIVLLSMFSFSCKKEQKVIFVADSISFKWPGSAYSCQLDCKKVSEVLEDYLKDGWKIISFMQRDKNYDNTCTCIGSEYVIEK